MQPGRRVWSSLLYSKPAEPSQLLSKPGELRQRTLQPLPGRLSFVRGKPLSLQYLLLASSAMVQSACSQHVSLLPDNAGHSFVRLHHTAKAALQPVHAAPACQLAFAGGLTIAFSQKWLQHGVRGWTRSIIWRYLLTEASQQTCNRGCCAGGLPMRRLQSIKHECR